mgnify:CR=1 FL=1
MWNRKGGSVKGVGKRAGSRPPLLAREFHYIYVYNMGRVQFLETYLHWCLFVSFVISSILFDTNGSGNFLERSQCSTISEWLHKVVSICPLNFRLQFFRDKMGLVLTLLYQTVLDSSSVSLVSISCRSCFLRSAKVHVVSLDFST